MLKSGIKSASTEVIDPSESCAGWEGRLAVCCFVSQMKETLGPGGVLNACITASAELAEHQLHFLAMASAQLGGAGMGAVDCVVNH
ncbi:hypothetical protein E2C01_008508 [Portunus trituberculatus]|uniref:Uncharacterized protein n=1 Tax=Portunus trituberculatus TaxID=210409 RepID=A0A5B7D202_PORTR|nr:hypothetical protein [Portunus trituberculatus]